MATVATRAARKLRLFWTTAGTKLLDKHCWLKTHKGASRIKDRGGTISSDPFCSPAEAVVYDDAILDALRNTPPGEKMTPVGLPAEY